LLALTPAGGLAAIDPTTLRATTLRTRPLLSHGGLAVGPSRDVVFASAPGPDRRPAVWAFPLGACRLAPTVVVDDAELPSASPDGGFLGYVTLNRRGHQTGVAIVPIDHSGNRKGQPRRFPAVSVPPPLPIRSVAVGPNEDALAVWGGFVDPYLGPRRMTVGTLTPASASSLRALVPVFDGEGASMPFLPRGHYKKPEAWQSSPLYLPNGEFLVGDPQGGHISMPYTDTTPGVSGGGIRGIVSGVGPIGGIAAGSNGDLAWLSADGAVDFERNAVNLPFGPAAEMPPTTPNTVRSAPGRYTAIANSATGAAVTTPAPVFHFVDHLPNVVGMTQNAA
jgi:hypothetical protein